LKELPANHERIFRLSGIPLSSQKFKTLRINSLLFNDSTAFLPAALDKLVQTLVASGHKFPLLRQWPRVIKEDQTRDEDLLKLCMEKGHYPYAWVTDLQKLETTSSLPPKDAFFNDLVQEDIKDEDYAKAQNVFSAFDCQNMLDYSLVYNELDVYLLAEVLMDFRQTVYDDYGLDATHFLSLPHLSKNLLLMTTKAKPELLWHPDMVTMIKSGIRGGHSFIGGRMVELRVDGVTEAGELKTSLNGEPRSLLYLDVSFVNCP